MLPTKTEAIKRFLEAKTHPDLAALYSASMEVQVNVHQANGKRLEKGWQNEETGEIWKPFRIPWNAKTKPEYEDGPMLFNLEKYVDGIGMTGWDWENRVSRWVGFDFDAITGHSDRHERKLTDKEFHELERAVEDVPWVTLRYSTSGKGRHIYVFLEPFPTQNHDEHAALARAILSMLSGITGFDFKAKVDVVGSILWVWHRKLTDYGLTLIKQGTTLSEFPPNWREHLQVITQRRARIVPELIEETVDFEDLSNQKSIVKLDESHKQLLAWLREHHLQSWWDSDHHMLVTHTAYLKKAHEELGLKGLFDTVAQGTEWGSDHNCLGGETEVLTDKGIFTLRELANVGKANLLVHTQKGPRWIESEIKSFGKQRLATIELGDKTKIRATATHEWLVYDSDQKGISNKKKYTCELVAGKTVLPVQYQELPYPDQRGYAHGFVFGDGWRRPNKGYSEVSLFGHKDDLLGLLLNFGTKRNISYKEGKIHQVGCLPIEWKELPDTLDKEYLFGFILGLISSDGNVFETSISIFNKDYYIIKKYQYYARHVGLRAFEPTLWISETGFIPGAQHWRVGISSFNLNEEHFIRRDQKQKFQNSDIPIGMTIKSIGEYDQEEEVFCAVVPFYNNFTLANGVITGNCYCFPSRKGSWTVRRFSKGIREAACWDTDSAGWARVFYNRNPDFDTACRHYGGILMEKGGYTFTETEMAAKAAEALGVFIEIPDMMRFRPAILSLTKMGKLMITFNREKEDRGDQMSGWLIDGKTDPKWKRVYSANLSTATPEPDTQDFDNLVRNLVNEENKHIGWFIKGENGEWSWQPRENVKDALAAHDSNIDTVIALGTASTKWWKEVSRPFEPEYLPDRQWNRHAAQFRVPVSRNENRSFPTWTRLLNHLGEDLNEAIQANNWCEDNRITTGGDYLRLWIAALCQFPLKRSPYLFFYSDQQNTGKSTLYEALQILIHPGVMDAKNAITSSGDFSGELKGAVVCFLNEVNLAASMDKANSAYNKIKDYTTAIDILIHPKGQTPYLTPNTTHWIQVGNDRSYCPIFPGDTRITMFKVNPIPPEEIIGKEIFLDRLRREASDFLAEMLALEIPEHNDRMIIPVIETEEKRFAESLNESPLIQFIKEHCHEAPGHTIKASIFRERFNNWLPEGMDKWSTQAIRAKLPFEYSAGRNMRDNNQMHVTNLSFEKVEENGHTKLTIKDGIIVW